MDIANTQLRGQETEEYIRPAADEQLPEEQSPDSRDHEPQAVERIRLRYKGVRVAVSGLPSSRKLSDAQKAAAAELFDADPASLSLSTNLWNAKEPAVRELRSVLHEISRTFHDRRWTLPSPHDGLRLIRRDAVKPFHARMTELSAELSRKARELEEALPQIMQREMARRGAEIFSAEDYNFKPTERCQVAWWFPQVMEDRELAQIDDSVYQEELQRVRRELEACVRKAEEEIGENLYLALKGAASRLGNDAAGEPFKFRNTTVTKLFDELSLLTMQLDENSIGGQALAEAAAKLHDLLDSQSPEHLPDSLRRGADFRNEFRQSCDEIAETLLATAIPAGRRAIMRKRATRS